MYSFFAACYVHDCLCRARHFLNRLAFFGERARWTGQHTLAAIRARLGVGPVLVQIRRDTRANAPRHDLPDVRNLDVRAHSYATRAQYAPVVIEYIARMARIHLE